ncbi:NADH-ubiquinone oxidoreductase 20.9 kDa subunit [Colletotrichum orbiculare MAFF 240422]|uniref:NADH-ubiquinone oxidoreductase 20.9 kDa subunit n=1 Tax=Colletotrichum orbiculare (strain 104-T / ATCC 96160 / CBS 514.97 / LARS 414 / MAFF 240422) TaxID=1213857 RepID=A0A484FYQ5_COLOR|nr:NADH-ubiquinone oxidoreductase 20.9 kDa subunit [Colletotrichum orbiculare MAFF 240422]
MATAQAQTYIPTKVVKSDHPLIDNDPHFKRPPLVPVHYLSSRSAIGLAGGFLYFYQRSSLRFYGATENAREVAMDMNEMVAKVKAGEPLYGESRLTPHMQGVAARQSRYSALFMGVIPWFNFVNHNQHGVDTAKYYQQAERELEAERVGK